MYDNVYEQLVEHGVAKTVATPTYRDKRNNVVSEDSKEKIGQRCEIDILHPEYFLTFDESGCNTNMKDDGNIGGEKFVIERGCVPKLKVAITDHRFTIVPIVAVSGLPVLCIIIFARDSKHVHTDWETGIEIRVRSVKKMVKLW